VGGIFQFVIRVFSALILGFFSIILWYGVFGTIFHVVEEPKDASLVVFAFLAVGIPIAYFLLLIAWRALTNSSSRTDGGLLPPFAIQVFAICYGGIALFGLVGNLYGGHYLRALGGLAFVAIAVGVVKSCRLREREAKLRQRSL
jgi:hypothetical protein